MSRSVTTPTTHRDVWPAVTGMHPQSRSSIRPTASANVSVSQQVTTSLVMISETCMTSSFRTRRAHPARCNCYADHCPTCSGPKWEDVALCPTADPFVGHPLACRVHCQSTMAPSDPWIERLARLFREHPAWREAARFIDRRATNNVFFSHRPGRVWHLERDGDETVLLPGTAPDPDFVFRFP